MFLVVESYDAISIKGKWDKDNQRDNELSVIIHHNFSSLKGYFFRHKFEKLKGQNYNKIGLYFNTNIYREKFYNIKYKNIFRLVVGFHFSWVLLV